MNLGIAAEATTDIGICFEFCKKILQERKNLRLRKENRYSSGTQINSKKELVNIKRRFFENPANRHRPSIVIIFSDSDTNKCLGATLNNLINNICFPSEVVVATPEARVEDWLVYDTGSINQTFNIKVTPGRNIDSKKYLSSLIGRHRSGDDYDTICLEIAKNCSLVKLEKLNDFGTFARALRRAANKIIPIAKPSKSKFKPAKLTKAAKAQERIIRTHKGPPVPHQRRRQPK